MLDSEPLSEPVLILAYAGWSDAGESASTALRYLSASLDAPLHARVDMEEFLDFTVVRPQVELDADGAARRIAWPDHTFHVARLGGGAPDLLMGLGHEPHLRWRTYAEAVVGLATAAGVKRAVLLGAYLADVIYSQPTQIRMSSRDAELIRQYELATGTYEGPTGILTVIAEALQDAQIPCLRLWAQIPHYVSTQPNPRGALALLQHLETVTSLRFDLGQLGVMAGEFDLQVSEMIANDPHLSAYVRELKRRSFSQ
jgi:hypothetical protein